MEVLKDRVEECDGNMQLLRYLTIDINYYQLLILRHFGVLGHFWLNDLA